MHRDEKELGDGDIKVWRADFKEAVIHHNAGLTISLNDLEEIELFQWLQNDLSKRGLLPSDDPMHQETRRRADSLEEKLIDAVNERENLREALRQAYVGMEALNDQLKFKR